MFPTKYFFPPELKNTCFLSELKNTHFRRKSVFFQSLKTRVSDLRSAGKNGDALSASQGSHLPEKLQVLGRPDLCSPQGSQ